MEFFLQDQNFFDYLPLMLSLLLWIFLSHNLERKNNAHRHFIIAILFLLSLNYLRWRIFETLLPISLNTIQGIWIWLCFFIEIIAISEYFVFYLNMYNYVDRHPESIVYEKKVRYTPSALLPTVDVYITTYNEGIEVIERTIISALRLDWPKNKLKIYVLDDGKREWLENYCKSKGAHYITREKNIHYKAGNINNALNKTNGEYILVLDADFIPFRQFIYRTIGFLINDPKIAIVQTPQCFYNHDYIQTNLHLHSDVSDDQRIFFDIMMQCRDYWDASFWCGTSSIVRRSALEEIGGVPTDTVTEDIATTLVMFRKGYITRFLNEKLSHGIAPENLNALMIQRKRWCKGSIQTLYTKYGVLGKNLKLIHRILFFPIFWIAQPFLRFFVLIIPIIFLITGLSPIYVSHYTDIIFYQAPLLCLNILVGLWLLPQHFVPFLTDASASVSGLQLIPSMLKSLLYPFKENKFLVTPKGELNKMKKFHSFSLILSSTLFVLTLYGLLINLNPVFAPISRESFFPVAFFMAMINLITLSLMIFLSIEHPRHRKEERFHVDEQSQLTLDGKNYPIHIIDISLSGVHITLSKHLPIFEEDKINIVIPNSHNLENIKAEIVRVTDEHIHAKFIDVTEEIREELISHIYTGKYHYKDKEKSFSRIFSKIIYRIFGHHGHLHINHSKPH